MYLNCYFMFSNEVNFVTNNYQQPSEGFGFQYLSIINSMLFAEVLGKEFRYTPFQAMAHNYENDPDFLIKKEKLINLIDHLPINRDIEIQKSQYVGVPNDCFPGSKTEQTVKRLFFANKSKEQYFPLRSTNIAIHIRKINSHDCQLIKEFRDIEFYRQLLDYLRRQWSKDSHYHIYSQGDVGTFRSLQSEDVTLHINESIEDTFSAMVLADVLITAYSGFSCAAGFLSSGKVFYFPHPIVYSQAEFSDGSSEKYPSPALSPLPTWTKSSFFA
jgi:hypothetical protein